MCEDTEGQGRANKKKDVRERKGGNKYIKTNWEKEKERKTERER